VPEQFHERRQAHPGAHHLAGICVPPMPHAA
jgi:hypothetical protein